MNLSFKQYRATDLGIMLVLLMISDALIAYASRVWFPDEVYVLSPTVAIVCIVMMRWGGFAVVQAVGGGFALCVASGASVGQFAVYCIGNCFALAALVMFKVWGKDKIRSKPVLTVLFTVMAFLATQIGRWLVGLLLGGTIGDFITFIATDSLSLLFAVLVVLIARRVDGLFEDQRAYLIRTQSERNRQRLSDYGDND